MLEAEDRLQRSRLVPRRFRRVRGPRLRSRQAQVLVGTEIYSMDFQVRQLLLEAQVVVLEEVRPERLEGLETLERNREQEVAEEQ